MMDSQQQMVLAAWLAEEAGETIAAVARADDSLFIDGLFDTLGVVLVSLAALSVEERVAGYEAYTTAQTDRDRDVDVFHHNMITAIIGYDLTEKDLSDSVAVIKGRISRSKKGVK